MDGKTWLSLDEARRLLKDGKYQEERLEAEMTKVMVLGDTHGNTVWTRDKIRLAAKLKVDKIIQCGDFGLWDHSEDGVRFLDVVNEECRKVGIKFYWVDGNHENHDRLSWYVKNNPKTRVGHVFIRSHILYIPRGCIWEWGGKRFAGVGGAYSIDKAYRTVGKSWWAGEQLTETQANKIIRDNSRSDPVHFLFTHDCSDQTPFYGRLKADIESKIHRQRIDKVAKALHPTLWFHGHMHTKYEWMYPLNTDATKWAQVYGFEMDGDNWSWGILDVENSEFTWGPRVTGANNG